MFYGASSLTRTLGLGRWPPLHDDVHDVLPGLGHSTRTSVGAWTTTTKPLRIYVQGSRCPLRVDLGWCVDQRRPRRRLRRRRGTRGHPSPPMTNHSPTLACGVRQLLSRIFLLRYSHDMRRRLYGRHALTVSPSSTRGLRSQGPSPTLAPIRRRPLAATCTEDKGSMRRSGRRPKGSGAIGTTTAGFGSSPACCASGTGDCCEPNPAAIAGAVVVGFTGA